MKYIDFFDKFKESPVINISDVETVFPDFSNRRLYEWQKAGYIKKITRGFYMFTNSEIDNDKICFVANKLREPSYISMEYALNYYSLIPEAVFLFTSITTKGTASYKTTVGNFNYRSVKSPMFFGYVLKGQGKLKYKIAEPEKAILDFLYLRSDIRNENDIEELRINVDVFNEIIDQNKLNEYLAVFKTATLINKVSLLNKYIQKNA